MVSSGHSEGGVIRYFSDLFHCATRREKAMMAALDIYLTQFVNRLK